MAAKLQGRVTNVSDDDLGSSLDGDHAAGSTSLKVQNAADFDEDGGTLVINDQQIVYDSCSDDDDTIALSEGLTAAADDGDTVSVWDTLREVIAVDKHAEVDVGPDYADDIEAVVAMHLVEHLVEGPRGDDGESVILELDEEDDEWKVVEILGLGGPGASGVQWEAQDVYVLTAADIAAGMATIRLSHRPMNESVDARWCTVPQEVTQYSVAYDEQTITWPLAGFERAGDRIWVHYTYVKGYAGNPIVAIVPFGSGNWKYKQVAKADASDYSAAGYDDSAWASGTAPFGNAAGGGSTSWAGDSRLWLRRSFPAANDVVLHIKVEDHARVWINGTQVLDLAAKGAGESYLAGVHVDVPASALNPAGNVIAIRANDDPTIPSNNETYLDMEITGRLA